MKRLRRIGRVFTGDATRSAIPVFVATMALEWWMLHRKPNKLATSPAPSKDESNVEAPVGYEPRDTAASLAMGVGSLVINAAAATVLRPVTNALFARRLLSLGTRRSAAIAALVLWDFFYYWDHRLSHEHRVLWAAHVNHHSSERYNLSTALRQSWTGFVVNWVFWPMLLVGFSSTQMARAGQLNLLYQYWVHTETVDRLPGGLERVFNSASHHRVHHGSDTEYLDRNYGGILIIWDRLFGTFEPEGRRVTYGLTKNINTHNPLRIAFHEWAAIARDVRGAQSWRERVGFTLGPPGWTPDRAQLTSPASAEAPTAA